MSFETALTHVLRVEGGYVNNPDDHGGATNKGITQAVYDAYRNDRDLAPRPVKQINDGEVAAIYRERYWAVGKCELLPAKLGLVHMDACVNHGPGRAARMLQEAVGATPDGIIGPRTLAAVHAIPEADAVAKYLCLREDFYARLAAKDATQHQFLKGWLWRLDKVREAIA